jgi:hypothetical protein
LPAASPGRNFTAADPANAGDWPLVVVTARMAELTFSAPTGLIHGTVDAALSGVNKGRTSSAFSPALRS